MPLISCPECNKQVSSSAPACPHCGAPVARIRFEEEKKNRRVGYLVIGGVALVLMVVANGINNCSSKQKPETASTAPLARQWKLVRTFGMQQIVLVEKAHERDQQVYDDAIEVLCSGETFCWVVFWSDAELVPKSMPYAEAEAAAMKAVYNYNQPKGFRQLLWSCEIVNDPSQCFRPDE